MRLAAFVGTGALLLAAVAGQNAFLQRTDASPQTSVITACAAWGGPCKESSPGGTPVTALSHSVLKGGCPAADLHIMRYIGAGDVSEAPLVASWCG